MTDSIATQPVTWLPLLREALAKEGHFRWPLHGNSMLPTLPADCEIELVPLSPPVKLGELIVFVAGDTLIAHRLVRRTGGYWIAQGDHRLVPDRPIRPDQVLGRVRGGLSEQPPLLAAPFFAGVASGLASATSWLARAACCLAHRAEGGVAWLIG